MNTLPTVMVCVASCWKEPPGKTLQIGNVTLVFNQYHEEASLVIDIKETCTSLSRQFPPEARIWVHLEPVNFTSYFLNFEQYYAGGVLSWHKALRVLPQFRDYRNCDTGRIGNFPKDIPKKFGVGGLISHKNTEGMEGYTLRRKILRQQQNIKIPSVVYNFQKSWNGIEHDYPRPDAIGGLEYMFYLSIENCSETHYFTEKIVRSFAAMCVPLYFGDPAITDEFDADGMILINESNWLDVINNLTPEDYYDRLDALRRNYFRSKKYWSKINRIAAVIETLGQSNQSKVDLIFNSKYPLKRIIDASLIEVENGCFQLVDSNVNVLAEMNQAAALVFSLINTENTAASLVSQICDSLEMADEKVIRNDVAEIIINFLEQNFIEYDFHTLASPALVVAAAENVTLSKVGKNYQLVKSSKRIQINETSALIVSLCDGKRTLTDLVFTIAAQVNVAVPSIETDILQIVCKLTDLGFLTTKTRVDVSVPRIPRIPRNIVVKSHKPKILYLLTRYPQLSETYIKNEIEALKDDYEIKIISFQNSSLRYKNHHPFEVIQVKGNTMSDEIVEVDGKLKTCIEEFKPDVLHTHYLNNVRLVSSLSKICGVPFTVRAHSYDVLHSSTRQTGNFLPSLVARNAAEAINQENCLGLLSFPYTVDALVLAGINEEKIIPCYPVVDFASFYDRSVNNEGILNVEPCLPKKAVTDFIDLAQLAPQYRYSLYGMGHQIEKVRQYNTERKFPVEICDSMEPEDMPGIYKAHNWLIYTANFNNGNMGWPVAVFEAQAAGMGVCIANIHSATVDQLGGAGFVYNSIEEIANIIAQPYSDEMRERGFDNARLADIYRHKHLLTELWNKVIDPAYFAQKKRH